VSDLLDGEFDVTQNIKVVDELKYELLAYVSKLFGSMLVAGEDNVRAEALSNIIISAYILGNKTGIDTDFISEKVVNKLRLNLLNNKLSNESYDLLKFIRYGCDNVQKKM
jgi:hypothetical protein